MRLIVIAKQPRPGRVKTRLTPPYLPEQASALAAAALADTLDTVVSACASRHLAWPVRPLVVLDGAPGDWLPAGVPVVAQASGPFDERLAAAFDAVRGEPALLIGMDTPQVGVRTLVEACRALRRTDAVLGAALDGGWWALGLRSADGAMVRGVATSRPDTGAVQHARLEAADLRVADLPMLRDVDTAADVEPVAAQAPGGRFAALARSFRGMGETRLTQPG
ncbi:hypothetical protein Ga0074812_12610 [Parafrankia irregularis]|uniref:Glycosyltransferase n=1 Tax=Parafrankia irregularis TaxID=795642 RepID=A0A0S4QUG2_9ACTN|nr:MULTISPECIES: DUF2064 domain-containing protein [Parafrankia]CUU59233.1 hypothetical protein Ga0074812_12610 [Parafrankia irregularis]